MNAVSYDAISPNIAEARTDGAEVRVTWRCPATGRAVGESTASMAADPSLTSRVGASVKRSIASELIYGAARLVSNLVGGAAGRVISNAVYTAANDINTRNLGRRLLGSQPPGGHRHCLRVGQRLVCVGREAQAVHCAVKTAPTGTMWHPC